MLYDIGNPLQRRNFELRIERYLAKGAGILELTEKKPQRTLSQNAYLHVLLAYFAANYGESERYVKDKYFKVLCNADLFVAWKADNHFKDGRVSVLRSSRDLTTEEMALAITRFRNWSSSEGIYLPEPDEQDALMQAQIFIEQHKEYL